MGGGASRGGGGKRDSLYAWGVWRETIPERRADDGMGINNQDGIQFPDPGLKLIKNFSENPVCLPDDFYFLFIGLDGAGKSSLVNILAVRDMAAGKLSPPPSTEPERVLCRTKTHMFWAVDMPGRRFYRTEWFAEEMLLHNPPQCIVFVVDAVDSFRFPLVKQQFLNLTRIERLDGVSILILANKQDVRGAHSAEALRKELSISRLLRNEKRMLNVTGCQVTEPEGVFEAVSWAVNNIRKENGGLGPPSPKVGVKG